MAHGPSFEPLREGSRSDGNGLIILVMERSDMADHTFICLEFMTPPVGRPPFYCARPCVRARGKCKSHKNTSS